MSDTIAFDPTTPALWDMVAPGYTRTSQPVLGQYSRDMLDHLGIGPEDHVLDVASGPGTLSLQAAAGGARVHAVDLSPVMVGELRRQAVENGVDARIVAEVGDGQRLTVPAQSFTAAFSMFGLIFFPDRAAGLAGLHRALRPGGVVGIGSWSPMEHAPAIRVLIEVLQAAGIPIPDPGPRRQALTEPALFHYELGAAGFVDVEVRRVTHRWPAAGPEQWWHHMSEGFAPLVLLRRQNDAAQWERWSTAAKAAFAARDDVPPEGLTIEALLGTGRRP